jgi:hypothetical protein
MAICYSGAIETRLPFGQENSMAAYWRGALASVLLAVTYYPAWASPDYIEADSAELTSAYGAEVAERAFSDELTDTRTEMINASVIPEQECGQDPQFVLRDIYPYQVDPGDVIWIERYRIDCEKEQHRAILMLLNKDGKIQAVPMAPGTTITDPQLQVDAGNIVRTAALTRGDGSCSESRVVDTEVAEKPGAAGKPWKENWSVYACGTVYDLEVAFTPSEAGGTNVAVVANPDE